MTLPDPGSAAQEILHRTGHQKLPVATSEIESLFRGLQIKEEDLDGEGYLLTFQSLAPTIIIRRESNAARKRFTIAHELGHLRLLEIGVDLKTYRANKVAVEQWCDAFAAAILLPLPYLRTWASRFLPNSRWIQVVTSGPKEFGISREALCNRLANGLGLAIVIVDGHAGRFHIESAHWPNKVARSETLALANQVIKFAKDGVLGDHYYDTSSGYSIFSGTPKYLGKRRLLIVLQPGEKAGQVMVGSDRMA